MNPLHCEINQMNDVWEICCFSYEGDKLKGMYHGSGEAQFAGGHHYEVSSSARDMINVCK